MCHSMSCTDNIAEKYQVYIFNFSCCVYSPLSPPIPPLPLSLLCLSLLLLLLSPSLSLFSLSSLFHLRKEGCTENNGVVFAHKVSQYSRWVSSNHLKSWEDEVTTLEEVYDLSSCIVSEVTVGKKKKKIKEMGDELGGWEGIERRGEGELLRSHFSEKRYCYEQPCMPQY